MNWDFTKSELKTNKFETITVLHNMPLRGPNNIEDVFLLWSVAPSEFSAESFCEYIKERRERGLGEHFAFPNDQAFIEWIEDLGLDMDEENENTLGPSDLTWIQLNGQVHEKQLELNGEKYKLEIVPYDLMPEYVKEQNNFPKPEHSYLVLLTINDAVKKIPVFKNENFKWTTVPGNPASEDKEMFAAITNAIEEVYKDVYRED